MKSPRSFLPVLTLALLGLLICAASASAEVRTGAATSPTNETVDPDLDILQASARYDSATGADNFTVVTRGAPEENINKNIFVGLFTVPGTCDETAFDQGEDSAIFPFLGINATYTANSVPEYFLVEQNTGPPQTAGPASKGGDGATTVLTAGVPQAANRGFNCALVEAYESDNGTPVQSDVLVFPIVAEPAPTPERIVEIRTTKEIVPTTVTKTVTVPAPAGAPAALSIAKPKPVTASSQKFSTVKVAVTNTGGTASGPVTIKLKAPKGVTVKPGSLRLPALLPGQTWTVPVRVKLTDGASKSSTVGVTASLPGDSATASFVVKSSN